MLCGLIDGILGGLYLGWMLDGGIFEPWKVFAQLHEVYRPSR